MALTIGTNCGFVTSAPSADPTASNSGIDNDSWAFKETVPADAVTVTEIGFWIDSQNDEGLNWEVGIYDDDGGGGTSVPVNLLAGADQTNALPSGNAQWVSVTGLSIDVSGYQSNPLWIAVQVDNTITAVNSNFEGSGSRNVINGPTTLPDPWTGGSYFASRLAIYAVYETAAGATSPGWQSAQGWK